MSGRPLRAFLAGALLLCFFPATAAPAQDRNRPEFEASRLFAGHIRADMAEYAARTAAENAAMREAMRRLAALPEMRFAGEVSPGGPKPPSLAGLALLLYRVAPVSATMRGYPPHMSMDVRLALIGPEHPGRAVVAALARPDAVAAAARVYERREMLLDAYDRAALPLMRLPPAAGGDLELLEADRRLKALRSLDIFLSLLEQYGELWPDPEAALEKLNACLALDPENAPALAARAEVRLKLDKPDQAMDDARAALALDDPLDRAHDALGTALLVRRLPALAAQSFGRAAALSPRNPAYLLHRASAYLMLEEKEPMCRDLTAACRLGDCAGLIWAGKNGLCSGVPEEAAADTVPRRGGR